VLDGIKSDTVLVVSGAGFLNDGDLVKNVPANSVGATSTGKSHTAATSTE
jgi:hypothetical protein